MTAQKFLFIFRSRVAPHYRWTITDAGHLRGTPRTWPEAAASYCPLTATVRTLYGWEWDATHMWEAARTLGLQRHAAIRIVEATDAADRLVLSDTARKDRAALMRAAFTVAPLPN